MYKIKKKPDEPIYHKNANRQTTLLQGDTVTDRRTNA